VTRLFLVLPLLGLALAGCGGGDSTNGAAAGASTPAELTKQAYVEQASAICTQASTDLRALPQPTDAAGFTSYLNGSVAAAKKATTALSALPAPAADAAELKTKFTDPLSQQVSAIEALVPKFDQAAKAEDPTKAFAAIAPPQLPQADAAFLSSYGLTSCASLSQGSGAGSASGGQPSAGPVPSPS